jgi:N-acylneuraminate cytidylyltransferase
VEKIVAVIPARGGSRGIPRKNIKLLAGKPLIAYSIESALHSPSISQVVVSTEDAEIASISRDWGAKVVPRPAELARDATPTEPVLEQAVGHLEEEYGYRLDWIVLLQPTSPFREADDIERAWQKLKEQNGDSLLSVCPNHDFLWHPAEGGYYAPINYDYRRRPRRQQMRQYRENGSIYITRRQILMEEHCRLGGKVVAYVMPPENSLQIDSSWDWWLAEQILRFREANPDA